MQKVTDAQWAWLAGFWDGEGSIGFTIEKTTTRLNCQLSHTEFPTVTEILRILSVADVKGRGYTYQERDPAKHRDAHYVRITGTANILKLAKYVLPFAVTKKRHWELAIAWAESRIAFGGGLDSNGNIKRGGVQKNKGYSGQETSFVLELKELNRRGPADRVKRKEGRIRNESA